MRLAAALLLPSLASATYYFRTCDEPAPCIQISKEALTTTNCNGDCDIQVCVQFNWGLTCCNAGTDNTVQHVCSFNNDETPDTCAPDPISFDGWAKHRYVADGDTHCILLKAGQKAPSIFKDASYCSDLTSLPAHLPAGTTCVKSTVDMYDDSVDFQSCTGMNKLGKECVWMIPPGPEDCGPLDDPPPNGVSGDPHFRTWS